MLQFLSETNVQDLNVHYGNLIFFGCFCIAAMIIGIWWLKRNS
jgi:hypothetical protein